jgi:hypothetical protein
VFFFKTNEKNVDWNCLRFMEECLIQSNEVRTTIQDSFYNYCWSTIKRKHTHNKVVIYLMNQNSDCRVHEL